MVDLKITQLVELTAPAPSDLLVAVDDPGGTPETKKLSLSRLLATAPEVLALAQTADGRLTLTSGSPAPMADVTAATTLYYTPNGGNRVALFDGTCWRPRAFSERSISLAGCLANTNYDVFLYESAGVVNLELGAWASSGAGTGTRATALAGQDGVWVKSGDPTRRYLGTIRTTGTAGQSEDSAAARLVWNVGQRRLRALQVADATSHTYNTTTPRAWNNNAAMKVDFVLGLVEDEVFGNLRASILSDGTALAAVGFGVNATSSILSGAGVSTKATAQSSLGDRARLGISAPGYHFVAVTEARFTGGTGTFSEAKLTVEVWG